MLHIPKLHQTFVILVKLVTCVCTLTQSDIAKQL